MPDGESRKRRAEVGFMAEQNCSDLKDMDSRSSSYKGKTKTSAIALASLICGITAPILLMILIAYQLSRNSENIRTILSCFMLSMIPLSIVLGIVALVRIHKSAGRLKGSSFANTALVINIIIILLSIIPIYSPHGDARGHLAKIQIAEFEQTLEAYAEDNSSLPTNEQGLEALISDKGKGPYLKKGLPNDPWGRPYRYRNPGVRNPGSYDLWSLGKDGIEGTSDDIANYE
jgi:general secretion pathway protein G